MHLIPQTLFLQWQGETEFFLFPDPYIPIHKDVPKLLGIKK